jgi:hypothetical protein
MFKLQIYNIFPITLTYHRHFMFPNGFCYPFGFARMTCRPVGIVANQPTMLAGVLDIDALTKAAQLGYIDEIIKPEETRKKLIQAWK